MFMNKLMDILQESNILTSLEDEAKYKYIFLILIIAISVVILVIMGVKRFFDTSIFLSIIDFSFAFILMFILYKIKNSPSRFELLSSASILLSFIFINIVFLYAQNEPTRIILFFIFIASTVFLKGCRVGFVFTSLIIVIVSFIHLTSYFDTNYTDTELTLVSIYFIVFFLIIAVFENIKHRQTITLHELLEENRKEKDEIESLKHELELNNEHLEEQVNSRIIEIVALNKDVKDTQKEIVFTMGAIAESRSKETGNHVRRVAEYSKELALHCGIHEYDADLLKQASPMHDIGKVGIPDTILNKPGKLDADEWKIMQTHAELGYEMLRHSNKELLQIAAKVSYEHHEKWDGSGYPNGLKGEDISIEGRITAIADVFDALGSDRVYKKAWSDEKIFKLFEEESGKHFDPNLIDIFMRHIDDFLAIRDRFAD